MSSNNDDPLADLLGSVRRQKKKALETSEFAPSDKPSGETGLNPLDLLALPTAQRDLVNFLSRRKQANLPQVQERLGRSLQEVRQTLSDLKEAGYIHEALVDGELYYRVVFGGKVSRSGRGVPQHIWDAVDLDNKVFLKQIQLFQHLSDRELDEVTALLHSRHYKRNEVIVWQGNIGDEIAFVKSGIVGISRLTPGDTQQDASILAYLKQGDLFSEHNLLDSHQYPASATVTALSEVEVLEIKRRDLLDLLIRYDKSALELARMLSQRLIAINTRLSSTGADTKLSFIYGIGDCGTTSLGSTLAMILAQTTRRKAAYTEHPNPSSLPKVFDFEPDGEIYNHPGGFDVVMIEGAAGLPSTVRTTLVMDQLLNDYSNIVIGLQGQVDETVTYMLEKANQVVIVTSPDEKSWQKTNQLISQLRTAIHPERTGILIVVNRKAPDITATALPGNIDYDIPYLPTMPSLSTITLDNLPAAFKDAATMLTDRLGRTTQLGVYIPSTIDVDQDVDTSGYIQETMAFLGELFGGAAATTNEAHGVWNSEEVGLVSETIHIVRTYVTQAELDRYLGDVLEYVERLKEDLRQEAMALEVNQKLMLI